MCIGLPMRVKELSNGIAICEAKGAPDREVNMLLVPEATIGDEILVHAGNALRKLDPGEGALIADALSAIELAAAGESFEHLLGDLIDREPQLPPHLQNEQ
jgi:hydrogenase expression/formation protein HypC